MRTYKLEAQGPRQQGPVPSHAVALRRCCMPWEQPRVQVKTPELGTIKVATDWILIA